MNTQKLVFSRLFDKGGYNKTELALKKKVNLALVDELITEFGGLEDAYSSASYLAYEYGDELMDKISEYRNEIGQIDDYVVNGSATMLSEQAERMQSLINDLENKAGELGLDPSDIFDDYQQVKDYLSNAQTVYKDAESKYREVVEYAGFLNNFW
jgi:hypothetical protein